MQWDSDHYFALRLQAEGKRYGQIAGELSIRETTVKYHAKENYRKLGVSGKADAVLAARNLGILYGKDMGAFGEGNRGLCGFP